MNNFKMLLIAGVVGCLLSCGGGSGGAVVPTPTPTQTPSPNNNIPAGTVSLGVLVNGSIVYISSVDFQVAPQGTVKGYIGITAGNTAYSGALSFRLTSGSPSVAASGGLCTLNSLEPLRVCPITISGNQAAVGVYPVITVLTNAVNGAVNALHHFTVTVTNSPAQQYLSLNLAKSITAGHTVYATVTVNGSSGSSPVTVNFTTTPQGVVTLNQASCVVANPEISTSCSVAVSAGSSQSGASASVTASANGYVSVLQNVTVNSLFVYTLNNNNGSIWAFGFAPSSGVVASSGHKVAVANIAGVAIVADPSGQFIYALAGTQIYIFSVNADGSLTQTSSSPMTIVDPVGVTQQAQNMVITPSGQYAYVSAGDGYVIEYARDDNGALRLISQVQASNGGFFGLVTDPTGQYLYVADNSGSKVVIYSINSVTGILSANGSVSVGSSGAPYGIVVDALGRYVYVTDINGDRVYMYLIGVNGGLTALTNPAFVSVGFNPTWLAIDASSHVYGINSSTSANSLFMYGINSGGELAPIGAGSIGSGTTGVRGIAIAPTDGYVLVVGGTNQLQQFSIGSGGSLVAPSSFTTGSGPVAVTFN